MKYVDEFRDSEVISRAAEEICRLADPARHYRIMEVCGGHTHAIYRFWTSRIVLPPNLELVHGPGCPVCVLPMGRIDDGLHDGREIRCDLYCLWRHDARTRRQGEPAWEYKARGRGRAYRLFSRRRPEAGAEQPGAARDVLRHRVWYRPRRPPRL